MPRKTNLSFELKNKIIDACESHSSMLEAAKKCNLPYTSFIRYAKKLNVYKPSDHVKALQDNRHKRTCPNKIPLEDIIHENKHPYYNRQRLKKRLISNGYLDEKCYECGITNWNNKKLTFHLEHIDGNSQNHHISNLTFLCPNCHSQTDTYCRGQRTTKNKRSNRVSDDIIIENIPKNSTIRQVLLNSGLTASQANYNRVDLLIKKYNLSLK